MNDFLAQAFLGNPVKDYLLLIGVLLFVFLIKRFLSRGVASIIFALVKHWSPGLERKDLVNLLLRPVEYFLLLITFMLTINRFRFPQQLNVILYKRQQHTFTLQQLTDGILEIIFSLCVIWILLRLIDFVTLILEKKADLTEDQTDNQFIVFFRDFFKAIIFILGVMVVVRIIFGAGLVEKLVAGLGIGAAALALAAKESIENLIGSFIIFFDKPFRVGDTVRVDAFLGTVEKIGLRSTRIRTLEKTYVTVPNKKMVDSILDNLSLRTQQRVSMRLELAAETPAANVTLFLRDVQGLLKNNPSILKDFTVNLHDFTKDTYVIQIIYMTYILEGGRYNALREEVNLAIIKAMEQHDIKLPSTKVEIIENKP
ncbi:mechanosensitive ion channel family protein [Chitinophaga pendula]|uniref:mechanosensitive ion channel family protein n=1 Tax=Chitinophaga TaxID=79328 RepID=UPI000BB0A848|nr:MULTISPECIES: mechanosensitive ion channel domain-containing protein [Chitinophaga]ASZ10046.1 hypothetical protein CK934_03155 [Chitinophaga sp. MD30]UCJ07003.1 mechanosensitive ion channel family protein [Chitinophaga pendula]